MKTPLTLFQEFDEEKEQLASLFKLEIFGPESYPDYDSIIALACHVCKAPIALLCLANKTHIWFRNDARWEADDPLEIFRGLTVTGREDIIEVPDTFYDDHLSEHPLVTGPPFARFYAEVPLIASDKTPLGSVFILDTKPGKLNPDQVTALHTLVRQIIIQIELKLQKRQLKQLNTGLLKDMQQRIDQKSKILELFSRFVPPEVITRHIQAELTGFSDAELKHCAILFCDIRGYTALVEHLSPANAVGILNVFYTIMSDVIKEHSGMVVQYVGDEIFAIFGKPFSFPEYERNAVFCAMEMMSQLAIVNELCKDFTDQPILVGIGINAGEVITGTLGSDVKIEYCVTGNNVNIGKRIESLTKEKPNTILISETVYDKVKDIVEVITWQPIKIKGKSNLLQIYEVTGKTSTDRNFPF
jgi:class 3 adenylate cyclase